MLLAADGGMRCAWLLLLIGCNTVHEADRVDGNNAGGACHATSACTTGLACVGPDDFPGCGVAPMQQCASDNDCPNAGDRCHAVADSCSPDGVGSVCRPACTSDGDCDAGFACPSGACVAVPCDAGFTCEARQACDPSRIGAQTPVYDRTHGCFDVACTTDADCGARSCVNGVCQDGVGECMKVEPKP